MIVKLLIDGWICVIIDVLDHLIDAQDIKKIIFIYICEVFVLPSLDQKSS